MSINRQDPRYIRSEKALQKALRELIRERSFQTITVDDIATRAGVARKTFYAHYGDKDGLLWQTMETIFEQIVAQMGQIDPETLLVDGKPLSYPIFRHVQEYALFYRDVFQQESTNPFLLRMWSYIARISYIKHSPIREIAPQLTVSPELIAEIITGAALGAVRWWLETDMQQTPETMAYTFSMLLAPGVLAAAGLDGF
jgi:AcrR family transcriptional regulator